MPYPSSYGTAFNTVKVRKVLDYQDEYPANAAITPGMCVELLSTGKVQKCATASGKTAFLWAVEDELQGKGINDDYATDDKVQCWIAGRGDVVNALLMDEENVVLGDFIEIAAGGRVKKFGSGVAIGIAVSALNLSSFPEGSDSSAKGAYYNPRILVQML